MTLVGIFLLRFLADQGERSVKLVVGSVLCILVATAVIGKFKPVEKLHWGWGVLACSASGLLAGLVGMGGPPLVFWTLMHDWTVAKTRGFLFAVFVICRPLQLVLLYGAFGPQILHTVGLAVLLMPAVFAGAALGLPLGNRLSKPVLRMIVYAVLATIGLSSVISSV